MPSCNIKKIFISVNLLWTFCILSWSKIHDDQVDEKVATFKVKIGRWFVVVGCGSQLDFCPDEFISTYLKMMSCVRPYMATIQTVPMNLSDLISVHSMFQLLSARHPFPHFKGKTFKWPKILG